MKSYLFEFAVMVAAFVVGLVVLDFSPGAGPWFLFGIIAAKTIDLLYRRGLLRS